MLHYNLTHLEMPQAKPASDVTPALASASHGEIIHTDSHYFGTLVALVGLNVVVLINKLTP